MSRYDDDFDSPDESEDTDPIVRELRTEIIRLEAQLDQLRASVREQSEETAVIQARLTALELRLTRLETRRRRDERLLVLAWLMLGASLALWLYTHLSA